MLPFLAELPDPQSATSIGWLILSLAGLAVAYNAILSIVDRHKKKEPSGTEIVGQPLEVRGSPEYARREELHYVVTRQDRMDAKLDVIVKDLSDAGEERARRLHARLDQVMVAVSEVKGELKRLPCDRCTN